MNQNIKIGCHSLIIPALASATVIFTPSPKLPLLVTKTASLQLYITV